MVARLPDGLDTQLGKRFGGVNLSEGQWQKVALARGGSLVEAGSHEELRAAGGLYTQLYDLQAAAYDLSPRS